MEQQVDDDIERCLEYGPQSTLERQLLNEYLESKGYTLKDLPNLPSELVKMLMLEACRYASLKLAELESRARFLDEIRMPPSSG